MKKLSIIIPCFNSSENIADLGVALSLLKGDLDKYELEIILVDDGSSDDTYFKLQDLLKTTSLNLKVVKLTGNFGSYNAFLAGLNHGTGNVYAQLHPDLQDPPQHLKEMLAYWEKGIKFVIGQRVAREDKNQAFPKFYHWLMKKIALPHIPEGGYDLIVFDKELRDKVVAMNESNTNLVYLISWLQYPFVTVPVKRLSRKKGKSQWTLPKKTKLLFDSIVSFSYFPIRVITITTVVFLLLSFLAGVLSIFCTGIGGETRLIFYSILIFGNLALIFLSIIAEYAWRALEAARKRPPFIVEEIKTNF